MRPPSPALAISLIALAVALGGTGYAVTQLPANSVGTKQIRKNAVTGAKVKAGSLDATDFKKGTLLRGEQGPQGLAGPAGPTASTWAQSQTETAIGLGDTVLLDTGTSGPGNITVTVNSRLVLTGSVNVHGNAAAWGGGTAVMCYPVVRNTAGDLMKVSDISDTYSGFTVAGEGWMQIPVTNSSDVPPGTYRVRVTCSRFPVTGTLKFYEGNIQVIAVGR